MNKTIKIFPNIDALNDFAADKFIELAADSMERDGIFKVALAGGSTPKSLYRLLASEKIRDKVFWKAVHFYFGDERNVPPTRAESNFRMANESLFAPLQIPELNINRWITEYINPERIVREYERRLRFAFTLAGNRSASNSFEPNSGADDSFPRFDLILLGMGGDGHTASLFPFTKALHETDKAASANYVEKLSDWRFTFTYRTINNARNVMFLVSGAEKAETLKAVLEGEFEPEKLPSQNVKPENGNLFWLVDEPAASYLSKRTTDSADFTD